MNDFINVSDITKIQNVKYSLLYNKEYKKLFFEYAQDTFDFFKQHDLILKKQHIIFDYFKDNINNIIIKQPLLIPLPDEVIKHFKNMLQQQNFIKLPISQLVQICENYDYFYIDTLQHNINKYVKFKNIIFALCFDNTYKNIFNVCQQVDNLILKVTDETLQHQLNFIIKQIIEITNTSEIIKQVDTIRPNIPMLNIFKYNKNLYVITAIIMHEKEKLIPYLCSGFFNLFKKSTSDNAVSWLLNQLIKLNTYTQRELDQYIHALPAFNIINYAERYFCNDLYILTYFILKSQNINVDIHLKRYFSEKML